MSLVEYRCIENGFTGGVVYSVYACVQKRKRRMVQMMGVVKVIDQKKGRCASEESDTYFREATANVQ